MQPETTTHSYLLVDANVFFKKTVKQIKDTLPESTVVLTTPDVIHELKDQKTRLYFDTQLPFEVKNESPSASAIKRGKGGDSLVVQNFAKKTGDFVSLSDTDVGLIALAVDRIVQAGYGADLKKEPQKLKEAKPVSMKKHYRQFEDSDSEDEQEDDGWNFVGEKLQEGKSEEEVKESKPEEVGEEEQGQEEQGQEEQGQEEDSCEDEWITAQNINEKLESEKSTTASSSELSGVILATADFAMQNVALQLGISVLSSESGLRIRTLRTYCLICKSCKQQVLVKFRIQPDNARQFCVECGNHNLRKASLYVHENGTVTYFVNPLRGYSKRGTVFPLPLPKGGHKNKDIVLCEDQLLYGVRARLREDLKKKHQKEAKSKQDMGDYLTGQATQFVSGVKGGFNERNIRLEYGVGCKNPNSKTKPRYSKNKKRNH